MWCCPFGMVIPNAFFKISEMRKGNKERKKITDTGWENKGRKNKRDENENYYLL